MEHPTLDMTKLSLGDLRRLQDDFEKTAAEAKRCVGSVKEELARRYGESGKHALAQAGKDHGSTQLALQDGFFAKVDVKQEVKWDSAKLMAIAQTLPWERVQALFKIDFSMSETIYKGVGAAAPDPAERIEEARTTILKPPVVALIKKEG